MVKTFYKRIFNVLFGLSIIFVGVIALAAPARFLWIVALVLGIVFIVSSVPGIVNSLQEQLKLLRIISIIIETATLILGILLVIAAIFDIFVVLSVVLLIIFMSITLSITGVMRLISAITGQLDAKWFRVLNFIIGGGFVFLGMIILAEPIIGVVIIYFYVVISLFLNGAIRVLLGLFGVYEEFE